MTLQIRNAKWQDFEVIFKWLDQHQWNIGTYQYQKYFKEIDRSGYFVATIDGLIIASLSVYKWSEDYAFMDLFMVDQKYRGQGYGLKIWRKAVETVPNCNLGLDAVVEQQKTYEKSGFKVHCKDIRYSAFGNSNSLLPDNIQFVKEEMLDMISQYDQRMFPAKRTQFLKTWLSLPQSKAFVYLEEIQRTEAEIEVGNSEAKIIKGYAAIRKSTEGFRIGPLFADKCQIAQQLLKCCLGHTPKGSKIFIDIPDNNKQALQLAEKLKMQVCFTCLRMYTKGAPKNVNQKAVYGVTSTQLG